MEHNFNIKVAEKYGVHPAIILNNLYFWIEKNKANNIHFYDGSYWTYNSKRAFSELFSYMTERQIDYAIKKLIDGGLIEKGNYNKSGYDRTLWYSITKVGYCILQNCKMEETKLSNGFDEIVEPIPYKKTDIKTDINIKKERGNSNSFDILIEKYAKNEKEIFLLKEWLKVRKVKRAAMTDYAIELNLKKMKRLADESNLTIDKYLEEIIGRGWTAFFKINDYSKNFNSVKKKEEESFTERYKKIAERLGV